MRVAARAAASTASAAVRRGHHLLLSTTPFLSTQRALSTTTPQLFLFSINLHSHHHHHLRRKSRLLRLVSMSASENRSQQSTATTPSYVVTVHAADEQALASARSRLGGIGELSAGGGATATVEFAADGGDGGGASPSKSSSSFDPALYFSSLRTRSLGRVLLVSPLLPSTQDLVQKASSNSPNSLSTTGAGKKTAAAEGNNSNDNSSSNNSTDGGGGARPLPDGAVCVADEQFRGRGRGANAWSSPRGCLAFSLTSDVRVPGTRLPFVQYLVSLALVRAARGQLDGAVEEMMEEERKMRKTTTMATEQASSSPPPPNLAASSSSSPISESIRIKWPNDVYARGGGGGRGERKKLAGVLCHSTYVSGNSSNSSNSSCFFRLTAGVGINVTNDPPPGAESLAGLLQLLSASSHDGAEEGATGQAASTAEAKAARTKKSLLSREALLAATLSELEPLLDELASPRGFSEEMRRSYEACWLHSGQVVEVDDGVELIAAAAKNSGSPSSPSASAAQNSQQEGPGLLRRQQRPRVVITGLSDSGFLAAVDAEDGSTRYELHPDGNSLDFFQGLVRRKA